MEILIPISLFAMIAAIVIVPRYYRSLELQKLQETLRAAYESGQSVPPELIESLTKQAKSAPAPRNDLRAAVIWLAIAGGFIAIGAITSIDHPDAMFPALGMAAFPGFIGLAFLVLGAISAATKPKS